MGNSPLISECAHNICSHKYAWSHSDWTISLFQSGEMPSNDFDMGKWFGNSGQLVHRDYAHLSCTKSLATQSITNTIKPYEMKYIRAKPYNESKYQKDSLAQSCSRGNDIRCSSLRCVRYPWFPHLCLNSASPRSLPVLLILSLHFLQMGRANRLLGP